MGGRGGREKQRDKVVFVPSFFSVIAAEGANVEGVWSGELRKALELAKKEMEGEKKKRISLERECAVYESQLEVICNSDTKPFKFPWGFACVVGQCSGVVALLSFICGVM